MGCCCADDDDDGVDQAHKGVVIDRHCTDVPCCVLLVLCLVATGALIVDLGMHSDVRIIYRGKNWEGKFCGEGDLEASPNAYFYDIPNRKAVCVHECPTRIGVLDDVPLPGHGDWGPPIFVPAPTKAVFGRCFPLQPYAESGVVKVCAWPECSDELAKDITDGDITVDLEPQSICAPKPMESHWLMQAPTKEIVAQWNAQDIDHVVVQSRVAHWSNDPAAAEKEAKKKCEVPAEIFTGLRMTGNPNGDLVTFLARYTSGFFNAARVVKQHQELIGLLGFVGALILSLLLTTTYTCCLRVAIWFLILAMLAVMVTIDYILFRKAGWNSGSSGAVVADWLVGVLGQEAEEYAGVDLDSIAARLNGAADPENVRYYQTLAVVWSAAIAGVLCVLCAIGKQIRTAIALVSEGSHCLMQMPSMLVFPYLGVVSIASFSLLLLWSLLGVMTLDPATVAKYFQFAGVENHEDLISMKRTQEIMCGILIFIYLWVYFFHIAIFTSVIANCVTNWYFYRDDESSEHYVGIGSGRYFFGKPVIAAFLSICRYDLGTLAFGSFLIALATMPRLVLEYVDHHMQGQGEENPVVRNILRAAKCCLWCFENCIKYLTEYAFINNAMTGKAFCSAARASFILIAKYPVQLALNNFLTGLLILVSCFCVPGFLVCVSYLFVDDGWIIVAGFILALSMGVTRISVGVFDIAVTTIFVCAMHDSECFGGQYAPPAIAAAMGLKPAAQAGSAEAADVEMVNVGDS